MSQRMAQEERFLIPVYSLLEGFSAWRDIGAGVEVSSLSSGDTLRVKTANTEYRIVLLDPASRSVTVCGGRVFQEPIEATVHGSGCGGAMIYVGWIGIGFQLELLFQTANGQTQNVVTSPVKRLFLERAEPRKPQ
jgi:hypothetical protein